jgi:hypothetical protein
MTTDVTDVVKATAPQFYRVRLSHPVHHKRTVFRSVSLKRTRAWVESRYPRGSEAYLEHPDGTMEAFENERAGDKGQDAELWQEFNPEAWLPAEMAEPPGDSAWADKEG